MFKQKITNFNKKNLLILISFGVILLSLSLIVLSYNIKNLIVILIWKRLITIYFLFIIINIFITIFFPKKFIKNDKMIVSWIFFLFYQLIILTLMKISINLLKNPNYIVKFPKYLIKLEQILFLIVVILIYGFLFFILCCFFYKLIYIDCLTKNKYDNFTIKEKKLFWLKISILLFLTLILILIIYLSHFYYKVNWFYELLISIF